MNTLICPTCGCSLARLGIGVRKTAVGLYNGKEYLFCCQGCAELFKTDPRKYLRETQDLIVCPTCLAEKPIKWAVQLKFAGKKVYFCRCPYCPEAFQRDSEYYLKRLDGRIPNRGVLDYEDCCVRPE